MDGYGENVLNDRRHDCQIRRPALAVLAIVLVMTLGAVAPEIAFGQVAPAPPGNPDPPTTSAAELDELSAGLTTDLASATAEARSATEALDSTAGTLDGAHTQLEAAQTAAEAARNELSHYAVVAYVSGGRDGTDAVIDLRDPTKRDSTVEGQQVLVASVGNDLIERLRGATVAEHQREQAATNAQGGHDSAAQRLQRAIANRDKLTGQLQSSTAEADRARQREDAEAERLAAQAAQASARRLAGVGEGPPNKPSVNQSGIVPGALAPGTLAALLAVDMPHTALEAYWRAAQRLAAEQPACGIDWALIAGIGLVETRHGTYLGSYPNLDGSVTPPIVGIALDGRNGTVVIRDTDGGKWDGDPVYDRAVGPMQFIPATWRAYGADGNGDGDADPHNIYDGAIAAARYLCSNARSGIQDPEAAARAVRAYNNSTEYVIEVLAVADGYRAKAIALGITSGLNPTTSTTATVSTTTSTTTTTTTLASTTTTNPSVTTSAP